MFETVFERASESLLNIVRSALDESNRLNNRWVCSEHLLLALARDNTHVAGQALAMMKLDINSLRSEIEKELKEKMGSEPLFSEPSELSEQAAQEKPRFSVFNVAEAQVRPAFSQIVVDGLKRATDYSLFFGAADTQPEHLLLGILDMQDAKVNKMLEELAANVPFLRRLVMAISAREAFARPGVASLRESLVNGFNELVTRYQSHVQSLTALSARAGGVVSINTPNHAQIVHMVCMSYLGDFLNTQVAFQRYLLEENIRSLNKRVGTIDKELNASIVSSGGQNLRAEVRATIEYIWCNQYRLLTRLLDEAEHDLIGSVIEDLWWAHSEEIALHDLFAEALDDHRRKQVLSLQKRRVELSQRLHKLRGRLEDTVRQCFVKHSISA